MNRWIPAALLAALVIGGVAMGQDKDAPKVGGAVGETAPDFRLNDHEGRAVRLSDFRGKQWVVLAFFPKAMTPG